jgi:hypothetical protein
LGSVGNSRLLYIVLGLFFKRFEFLFFQTNIGWVRSHVDHSGRKHELTLSLELGSAVFGDRGYVVDHILCLNADL